VGADSRTSVSGYVSNRLATKISFILEDDFGIYALPPSSDVQLQSQFLKHKRADKTSTEKKNTESLRKDYKSTCCICRSGSAADTQYLADTIRHQLLRRKVLHSMSSSVSEVAHLLKNYLHNDSLSASLICAGYDHKRDKGVIFSIDMGGTLMEQEGWACNGSGSGYILGMIDANYPDIQNDKTSSMWREDEAVSFVTKAIELAIERDGSSGGVVRIFVINKEGKKAIIHRPACNHAPKNVALSKFAPATRGNDLINRS